MKMLALGLVLLGISAVFGTNDQRTKTHLTGHGRICSQFRPTTVLTPDEVRFEEQRDPVCLNMMGDNKDFILLYHNPHEGGEFGPGQIWVTAKLTAVGNGEEGTEVTEIGVKIGTTRVLFDTQKASFPGQSDPNRNMGEQTASSHFWTFTSPDGTVRLKRRGAAVHVDYKLDSRDDNSDSSFQHLMKVSVRSNRLEIRDMQSMKHMGPGLDGVFGYLANNAKLQVFVPFLQVTMPLGDRQNMALHYVQNGQKDYYRLYGSRCKLATVYQKYKMLNFFDPMPPFTDV